MTTDMSMPLWHLRQQLAEFILTNYSIQAKEQSFTNDNNTTTFFLPFKLNTSCCDMVIWFSTQTQDRVAYLTCNQQGYNQILQLFFFSPSLLVYLCRSLMLTLSPSRSNCQKTQWCMNQSSLNNKMYTTQKRIYTESQLQLQDITYYTISLEITNRLTKKYLGNVLDFESPFLQCLFRLMALLNCNYEHGQEFRDQ